MKDKLNELLSTAKSIGYGDIFRYTYGSDYDEGAFDKLLPKKSEPHLYFQILKEACLRYPEIKHDPKYLEGYILLLEELVAGSATTEVPRGMKGIITENIRQTDMLRSWYRIK